MVGGGLLGDSCRILDLEVTGVSEELLLGLLTVPGRSLTESLMKALADSKSDGMNFTLLPLTSGILDQEPSITDLEHFCTDLARL